MLLTIFFYVGPDPEPGADDQKSRIRTIIVRIRNTGFEAILRGSAAVIQKIEPPCHKQGKGKRGKKWQQTLQIRISQIFPDVYTTKF
jgi:hypothetical protein